MIDLYLDNRSLIRMDNEVFSANEIEKEATMAELHSVSSTASVDFAIISANVLSNNCGKYFFVRTPKRHLTLQLDWKTHVFSCHIPNNGRSQ